MESSEPGLNPLHKQHLLTTFQYVDRLLSDIERALTLSKSSSPFPDNIDDVTPVQQKIAHDYIARVRAQILRAMESQAIEIPGPRFSTLHVIRTTLTFVDIAIEELRPKYIRGYGEVPPAAAAQMEGLVEELESLVERFRGYLDPSGRQDIEARIRTLGQRGVDVELLQLLNRIITERGLVEFRPSLSAILSRLEDQRLEIALFGRVSSGKSSLLNALLDAGVLPVGVTPITAVPTRITYGPTPAFQVWFANRRPERCDLGRLAEFVTEQKNPGNHKNVTRIVVTLPSERLREGVAFVDTPGLGSLATSGAAETLAYLPQCDLGLVLIDAGGTLTGEDLATAGLLQNAGIECHILLSKADLLSETDKRQLVDYIDRQIQSSLGLRLPISPVSSMESHRALLDDWFTSEILPLYERHADRVRDSLWKKTLLLKQAVEATLRTKIQRALRQNAPSDVTELEKDLRSAAAAIVECRRECEDWIRDLSDERGRLLDALARTVARTLKDHSGERDFAVLMELAVGELLVALNREIESLVETILAALDRAARSLDLSPPAREEFAAHMREMPRFTAPGGKLHLGPGMGLLGTRFAEMRIRKMLNREFGGPLLDAICSYSSQLETWFSSVIRNLELQFEAHADIYRVQLGSLGSQQTSSQDVEQIQRDLRTLEAWQLQPVV